MSSSDHTIWLVQRTRNGAVVPVCWRHTQEDAKAVIDQLEACRPAKYQYTYFFVLPVTDSVAEYDEGLTTLPSATGATGATGPTGSTGTCGKLTLVQSEAASRGARRCILAFGHYGTCVGPGRL